MLIIIQYLSVHLRAKKELIICENRHELERKPKVQEGIALQVVIIISI